MVPLQAFIVAWMQILRAGSPPSLRNARLLTGDKSLWYFGRFERMEIMSCGKELGQQLHRWSLSD